MQILVVCLWCTVATRVAKAQAESLDRAIADVGTWRDDRTLDHIMFVETEAHEEVYLIALPLVLRKETNGPQCIIRLEALRIII